MFKASNVKIGDNYKLLKRTIQETEDYIIGELPVFCCSDFKIIRNLETNEAIFIKVNNGVITEIATELKDAVNLETADRMIKEILNNN